MDRGGGEWGFSIMTSSRSIIAGPFLQIKQMYTTNIDPVLDPILSYIRAFITLNKSVYNKLLKSPYNFFNYYL